MIWAFEFRLYFLGYLATTKPKQLVKICTKYANNRPEITYIMKNRYPKLQEKIEDHEKLTFGEI